MYFVGIDISKYKHDCFITTETGEVIEESLTFQNTNEGFIRLLNLLKSLDNSQEIRIGFEATGHYGMNLKLFLEKNDYSFMEFNPALVKKFISGQTLRKTKTDKKDAFQITRYLMSVEYNLLNVSMDYIAGLTNRKIYQFINNEFDLIVLGKRLKEVRTNAGDSQEDVANIIGTTQSPYSKYELGKNTILTSFIIAFAKHYKVSIDWLCGKTKDSEIK